MSRAEHTGGLRRGLGAADRVDTVEVLRDVVLRVPGVVGLHSGLFGEVATYLPGRRVAGIRCGPESIEIHLVVDETADIRTVAAAVHAAVLPWVELPVHVVIDDLGTSDRRILS